MSVEITSTGLRVSGVDLQWRSGEAHYWRLKPAAWPGVLDSVAALGFTVVSTYVPWSAHEVAPGEFDFTGQLDIGRFCSLASERGLKVVVRPGPDAASEIPDSGWPRRILADERVWARRPGGNPYLLPSATWHLYPPSYASRIFMDEVAVWFDAVCGELRPHLAPDGPIVAWQVDNENGFHFQSHTYAMDYHPDSLAMWSQFSGGKKAPTDASDGDEVTRLQWVAFREHMVRTALGEMSAMLRERGVSVPLVHNDYPRTTTPQDLGALEAEGVVDLAGVDVYTGRGGGRFVRDLVRHASGSSRMAFMAEWGAGWLTLPWLLPSAMSAADREVVALRTFMSGSRGANVYMLVERDRWYGSPVAADGTLRDTSDLYPRVFGLLDRMNFANLRREAPVLILENRLESRRVAARDRLGELVPAFSQVLPLDHRLFSTPHPDTDTLREWESGFTAACDVVGVDCDRASTSSLRRFDGYKAILIPTLDAIEPEVWEALRTAAASGVTVLAGPRLPKLDDKLEPFGHEVGSIRMLATPDGAADFLREPLVTRDNPALDLNIWTDGGRLVVAAFNSTGEPLTATLRFEHASRLVGLWVDGYLLADPTVEISLDAWAVQVWEVVR